MYDQYWGYKKESMGIYYPGARGCLTMEPDPKFFCIFALRCKVKSGEECSKCFESWLELVTRLQCGS